MRPARRGIRLASALAALLIAGCGDAALATRWRLERALWHADRRVQKIAVRPSLAAPGEYDRAVAAFAEAAEAAPVERWLAADAPGDPRIAREVAVLSGRALLARAELERMRGRRDEARAAFADAYRRCRALPEVATAAAAASARMLDEDRRGDEALAWRLRLIEDYAPYDSATGGAVRVVGDAALRAAGALRTAGRAPSADSLLGSVRDRLAGALERADRPRPASGAWRMLAEVERARGDRAGERVALRRELHAAAAGQRVAETIVALADAALEAGVPDSARAYARWAQQGFGPAARLEGMRLEARAFEAGGAPDSALETWSRLLEAYPRAQDAVAESRFRRGAILEAQGRWELARSEYRALAAALPSHPLAFEAQLRIVQHHARLDELEQALVESRHAIGAMDVILATQHDVEIQNAARRTRAEAMLAVREWRRGVVAMLELAAGAVGTAAGEDAARRAAEVAAGPLADRTLADSLWRALAAGAGDAELRAEARRRLAGGRN